MSLKIMLTGKNSRVAESVSEHLEEEKGYAARRCAADKASLTHRMKMDEPQVVIICLGNENLEMAKDYDAILECTDADKISVIVVAYREDYDIFRENTQLKNLYFLQRPVSADLLYTTLSEIEQKLEAKERRAKAKPAEHREFFEEMSPYVGRKRVLVVDDDPEQLAQIKENLYEFYDVTVARSGPQAIKYLDEHKDEVSLILLDYIMPGMDGPAVLKYIRESGEYPWIPVVFLTGMTEKKKVIKTLTELKPQGYIVKPAKRSMLIAKIVEVLD